MLELIISPRFKKDLKKLKSSIYANSLQNDLGIVLSYLLNSQALPNKYKDHALIGNWKDFRECHVKPDLLLVYRVQEGEFLELARLASHSELGF